MVIHVSADAFTGTWGPEGWDEFKVLNEYRAHLARLGRAPGTIEQRIGDIRRLLAVCGPHEALTFEKLEKYISTETDDWSPAYRKKVYASYRIFFAWAKKRKYVQRDPTRKLESVRVPHYLPRPAPESVVLAAFEEATLVESAMLCLGASQGLRRTEIATAHPSNRDGDMLRVVGKGTKERVVPLDSLTLSLLQQIEELQGSDEYYFRGRFGGHVHPATVYKWLKRHLGSSWSTHNLRHRAATLGLRATGDLRGVQELLGHASLNTTQIYTQVDSRQLSEIVMATSLQRRVIEHRMSRALMRRSDCTVEQQEVMAAMQVLSDHLKMETREKTLM